MRKRLNVKTRMTSAARPLRSQEQLLQLSEESKYTKRPRGPRSKVTSAIAAGLVKKARRPFALFLQSKMIAMRGSSKSECKQMMKQVASEWRLKPEEDRKYWRDASAKEFRSQQEDMKVVLNCGRQPSLSCSSSSALKHGSTKLGLGKYNALAGRAGEGTFGTVVVVADSWGRQFAAKVFKDAVEVKQELSVYRALAGHPCFLPLLDHNVGDVAWIVLPLVRGGSALSHMRLRGAFQARSLTALCAQVATGLDYMHVSAKLLHLDIKPGNIMWQEDIQASYIIDFSLVEPVPPQKEALKSVDYCTPPYRPPEIWKVWHGALQPAVDTWSFGVTVYELATGCSLFKAADSVQMKQIILAYADSRWSRQEITKQPWLRLVGQECDKSPWLKIAEPFRSIAWQATSPAAEKRLRLANAKAGLAWVAGLPPSALIPEL